MASYPTFSGGSGISGLLRAIQEQKQSSPLSVPPSAEPGSPIRDLTQTPLMQAENPQSSRVIAARPELQGQQPGGSLNVVAPTLPVAPAVAPVAPVAPTPAPTPAAPAQSQAPTPAPAANPSISSNAGARAAGQAVLGASIGRPTLSTKIMPFSSRVGSSAILTPKAATPPIKGQVTSTVNAKTGAITTPTPSPTPTPTRTPPPAPVPQPTQKYSQSDIRGQTFGIPQRSIDWTNLLKNIIGGIGLKLH